MSDWLANIVDKEVLRDNLTFVSLFIAIYEHTVDYAISNIKSLLCDLYFEDGKEQWKETESYKQEIRNRIVDEKGNKDITKASFLWLVDNGAISSSDYTSFLDIKAVRNKYAHELTTTIFEGVSESEISKLISMCELLQRISRWFWVNVEAPIMGYEVPDVEEPGDIQSAGSLVFQMLLEVLYNEKSEEYKSIVAKIRGANSNSVLHNEVQ